jgi:hypothetical protein
MTGYTGVIHFTVSVWNRIENLTALVRDLDKVWLVDPAIKLHVCAFRGEDATPQQLQDLLDGVRFPSELILRMDEFGNGLGHNTAAASVEPNEMLALTAVDTHIPPLEPQMIRDCVQGGQTFYRPRMGQQEQDGKVVWGRKNGTARGLLACLKADYLRAGTLRPQRAPWHARKTTGIPPEDQALTETLKKLGLDVRAPKREDMYCRFHARDPNSLYYAATLKHARLSDWPKHVQQAVALAKEQNE